MSADSENTEPRSVSFWYSDTEDAAAKLVEAATQYQPSERGNFLRDAYRGAKVQLEDASNQKAPCKQ